MILADKKGMKTFEIIEALCEGSGYFKGQSIDTREMFDELKYRFTVEQWFSSRTELESKKCKYRKIGSVYDARVVTPE